MSKRVLIQVNFKVSSKDDFKTNLYFSSILLWWFGRDKCRAFAWMQACRIRQERNSTLPE